MTTTLTERAKALIARPVLANVATVDAEGRPQLTPVWIDLEGENLAFNTAKGRAKDANLAANPAVAVSVVDPDDPYNVVVVRGTVEAVDVGADAHIDRLAKKYLGRRHLPDAPAGRGPCHLRGPSGQDRDAVERRGLTVGRRSTTPDLTRPGRPTPSRRRPKAPAPPPDSRRPQRT